MEQKTLSMIVPIFNMAGYVPELWRSLEESGTLACLTEVIFVNDGSTDETFLAIQALAAKSDKVRIYDLQENKGRFAARLAGSEAATGTHLFFLDARSKPDARFGKSLAELLPKHDALLAMVYIDGSKSVYNLYWQRTHERIFWRNYAEAKKGFALTPQNYESYTKGTTAFVCSRKGFLRACDKYRDRPMHSDDTFLMREIVNDTPIWVEEKLAVTWEPRQAFWPFVTRLWERGPQFVEYHVFERQGLFFMLFLFWVSVVVATLALIFTRPELGLTIFAGELALLALSTALFARTPIEFVRLIPVHIGSILAYGLGAIYGVGVNLNLFRKPAPTAARK